MAGNNYTVQVNAGVTEVMLPGKGREYTAGETVELTPHEFAEISPARLALLTVVSGPGASTMTVVHAGADANAPRPVTAGACYWICDAGVTPVHAVLGDIIFNATG